MSSSSGWGWCDDVGDCRICHLGAWLVGQCAFGQWAGVGFASGILGGFAGLSGVLPLVWLQLRGFSAREQRARYQPFNLLVLGFASLAMLVIGKLDGELMIYAAISAPFTIIGTLVGVRAFKGVSDLRFRQAVLLLLLISGGIILAQSL